jgi:hypothetical protein
VVEFIADGISDYIKTSDEVDLLLGLKESIEQALSQARTGVCKA